MKRDTLFRLPHTSRVILCVGAAVHFALCIPLYGRRGFPEVDPFWLAMVWLWIPAIPISAIWDKWSRSRAVSLALYALATGFSVSWSTIWAVPSSMTPVDAVLGLIYHGPIQLAGVFLVELASRLLLICLRRFVPKANCETCGYPFRGLRNPRCPECGTPFPADRLDPSAEMLTTPVIRRWTTLVITLVLIGGFTFPPVYRVRAFNSLAAAGAQRAENDWQTGQVTWFVTYDELNAMSPQQIDRYLALEFQHDPVTGFYIQQLRGAWQKSTWQSSYREVIINKLRAAGRQPPRFEKEDESVRTKDIGSRD